MSALSQRVIETPTDPLVVLDRVTKAYPGLLANDRITMDLFPGEIHAVLGENGAGKSTLMGVMSGLHRSDAGRIVIKGQEVELQGPRHALALGIGHVQQHFSLIPTLTVTQNILLTLRSGGVRINPASARGQVRELSNRYSLNVDLDVPVERLAVGLQQRAELLKALVRQPSILILDEPTALLTPQEAAELATVMRKLVATGVGIFFISHNLTEVLEISDRITVLRRGRLVGTVQSANATHNQLAEMMIGELRTVGAETTSSPLPTGPVRMQASDVWIVGDRGGFAIQGVSLEVRGGEVVGIAGVEGSGQTELTEAISGVRRLARGRIEIDARDLTGRLAREFRVAGVAHVPADRKRTGLVSTLSVAENLVLPIAEDAPFSRLAILSQKAINDHAKSLIQRFDIRALGPSVLAGNLSGGNQQKLILARELCGRPRLIVACYPTRGLDIAATESVRQEILARKGEGAAVLYASTDLDELLEVTDRIIVLHQGRISGQMATKDATTERLGMLMGGVAVG